MIQPFGMMTWLSIPANLIRLGCPCKKQKTAQSRILLPTAKPNNFIAQIMAIHLEGSREVMAIPKNICESPIT